MIIVCVFWGIIKNFIVLVSAFKNAFNIIFESINERMELFKILFIVKIVRLVKIVLKNVKIVILDFIIVIVIVMFSIVLLEIFNKKGFIKGFLKIVCIIILFLDKFVFIKSVKIICGNCIFKIIIFKEFSFLLCKKWFFIFRYIFFYFFKFKDFLLNNSIIIVKIM